MTKAQALDELRQYKGHYCVECPMYSQLRWDDGQYPLLPPLFPEYARINPQAYAAQVNWNKAMRRLLENPQDWRTRRVPKPTAHVMNHADLYALAKTDGKAYKDLMKAIRRAA